MNDDTTIGEVIRAISRIEKKLDRITSDHEDRLRRLEKAVWIMTGVSATGVSTGIAALIQASGGL